MKNLNIHNDSRNRGLEILLYNQEENLKKPLDEIQKFKLSLIIPFFFHKEFGFQFEFYMKDNSKHSESK